MYIFYLAPEVQVVTLSGDYGLLAGSFRYCYYYRLLLVLASCALTDYACTLVHSGQCLPTQRRL